MNSKNSLIQIKGLRDGLLISLGEGEWHELEALLFEQIDERSSFFSGARLALDVGKQVLRVVNLTKLRDELSERSISLWAVVSDEPKTVQTAQLLGLATRISKQRPQEVARPKAAKDVEKEEVVLWVERTLRSGTRIEHNGHVVVMGDVNPGAEIVAAGNILVWGRLRGSVHVGADIEGQPADENTDAFVCALTMTPTRLQIASEIENRVGGKTSQKAVKISLKNGEFQTEVWNAK
ncbi:MAG: septum site-determining protein MinC [Anaerolineae bacterium]|jgi:septum site-determining protein MinC|nr:septum site-determining protein MinC [Anaerolineae bacterium]MBT7192152.1 septum site-determining protein MinC [Anaerolineae bacterium]MBT7991286.1 septum site-determining protein MinC [Anaerolineae bacterium]